MPHQEQTGFSVGSEGCRQCHDDAAAQYTAHGRGKLGEVEDLPDCSDCHGDHDILPSSVKRSKTHPLNLPETCGQLPREPRPHDQARNPDRPPDPDLRDQRPRPGHRGRRLPRRHLQRLPLHRRHRPQDPAARQPRLDHQPLQHSRHLRQVPPGRRAGLPGGHPRPARGARRDRRAGLHHLPRRARHPVTGRPALAGVALQGRRGDLLAVPRVGGAQREVRPADRPPGHVHRLLPRPEEQGRRHARGQLRVVPRRRTASCRARTRPRPSTRPTCRRPAASATRASPPSSRRRRSTACRARVCRRRSPAYVEKIYIVAHRGRSSA